MTSYKYDKELNAQADELSARLNGARIVYKVTDTSKVKAKASRNKWNEEAEKQRLRLLEKYGKRK